ncbi:MAG: hypothetical protein QOD72_757 [Acidimicrobiaceae bacterium]|jgi:DNA-binding NarL/FixJ family response regulator|nr:hypothetical protein [Acidimicrobiaceae bacterium]
MTTVPVGIRVLIIDDHVMIAESLRRMLDACDDMAVVGLVGTGAEGLDAARRLHPDVVLLDYRLPDIDGVKVAEQIVSESPSARIVMLTGDYDDSQLALRAIEAGCSGFLSKAQPVDELVAAVRAVNAGDAVIMPAVLGQLLPRLGRGYQGAGYRLSSREREVLDRMAEGCTDKEIAQHLTIAVNTARKHVQSVIQKLEAHSKLQAVVIAVRHGLVYPK